MTTAIDHRVDPLEIAYASSNLPCHQCGDAAAMIGLGHADAPCLLRPPPPYFKCTKCHRRWREQLEADLAAGWLLACMHCGREYGDDIDTFSVWWPV